MTPSLSIIIVNWNSGNQLRECVRSISSANCEGFKLDKIVVVDNGSTDESANGLDEFPLPLLVLRNKENRGFSSACNQGASLAKSDFMLFLNPDTRLSEYSLAKPIAFLKNPGSDNIGIIGVQLTNERGMVERSCARFPSVSKFIWMSLGLDRLMPQVFPGHFMTEWDHAENREVDQVMGSFFLVRGELFRALHGFDERFFVYFEEVDFSLRARQEGFRSYYMAETSVFHKGGGSSERVKALRLCYSLRSRIQYFYKHNNWASATLGTIATLLLEPVSRMAFALFTRSIHGVAETARGYALLWGSIPQLMKNAVRGGK